MRRPATLVVLLALALPARAAALAVAPAPANPTSACAAGNPCSLDHALQIASSGDEIVIPPGAYSLTYQRNLSGVNVHGIDGQPPPEVVESNNAYFALSSGQLRHVGILQTSGGGSSTVALASGASIEDAVVRCAPNCSSLISGQLISSIKDVVATAPKVADGIIVTGPNIVIRNVTVLVAPDVGSADGIKAYNTGVDTSVDLRNSIVHCEGCRDLAFVGAGTSVATLSYGWSDVRPATFFTNGGQIVDLGHDVVEDPPKIVDLVGGDAHLLATSALIDAGTNDALGSADPLDGGARVLGAAPDIGADEAYFAPPAAQTGDASAITQTAATIAGVVTPAGQATTYRFEWGTTTAYGQATADASVGNGNQPQAVTTGLSGLAPDTVYHYRVVATSPFGTTAGIDKVLRTAATPAPTPPAAFTGALSRTASAKLDRRRRFTITLACPASAVTSCTGTARLGLPGAKPHKFSAAAGQTARLRLTLTRAQRRLVGRKGLRVALIVIAHDAAGREHATVRNLLLSSAH